VVCKELGYDGGVVFNGRRQKLRNEYGYQLWDNYLFCDGTENSIYDCAERQFTSNYAYRYCSYIPEYSCQSMYVCMYVCILHLHNFVYSNINFIVHM